MYPAYSLEKVIENFWKRVTKTESCWLFNQTKKTKYGAVHFSGDSFGAHQFSWKLHFGAIPQGFFVCHKCDVKNCVKPDHLFLGTPKDNIQDCMAKGRFKPPPRNPNNRGERTWLAKLTEQQVREIYLTCVNAKRRSGLRKAAAEKHGVDMATIYDICARRTWRHVTFSSIPA